MSRNVLLLLGCLALLLVAGCDDVERREFRGLLGTVGYPPVANADIDIYDASRFENLDSTQGLIARSRTGSNGRFDVELNEKHLGRPLIVVARPTATSTYLDFGAPGNPSLPFTTARKPWVGVLREWRGGEDTITINPFTTMAFEALMRLPAAQVGSGNSRFDQDPVYGCNNAVGSTFGIYLDPAEGLPAPPDGAPFPSAELREQEDNDRSTAYTYLCLQFAKAANAFVAATADPLDNALDFHEACFEDAQDGVIDGLNFGQSIDFFVKAGAPAVVGRDVNGHVLMVQFVATQALTGAETALAQGPTKEFSPDVTELLLSQNESTGAARPTVVTSFDLTNYPYSGSVVLTVKGAGFRRSDRFTIRSEDDRKANFDIDVDSVGVDGQILFRTDSEMQVRLPDFANTSENVKSSLKPEGGSAFREHRFVIRNRPNPKKSNTWFEIDFGEEFRVTRLTGPLLVHAEIGRLFGTGILDPAQWGNNVYAPGADPTIAGPDVFALRVRIVNPSPTETLTGAALDLGTGRTTLTRNGTAVPFDFFGGAVANPELVFEAGVAPVNLAPGASATLTYRFVLVTGVTQPGAMILEPVLTATSLAGTVGTNDNISFAIPVQFGPAEPDATPELGTMGPVSAPANVTAGGDIALRLSFTQAPRAGTAMRDGVIETIELTLVWTDVSGSRTRVLRLQDSFFPTELPAGFKATRFVRDPGGGTALPFALNQSAPSGVVELTIRTPGGANGTLVINSSTTLRDRATRLTTLSVSSGSAVVNVTP